MFISDNRTHTTCPIELRLGRQKFQYICCPSLTISIYKYCHCTPSNQSSLELGIAKVYSNTLHSCNRTYTKHARQWFRTALGVSPFLFIRISHVRPRLSTLNCILSASPLATLSATTVGLFSPDRLLNRVVFCS